MIFLFCFVLLVKVAGGGEPDMSLKNQILEVLLTQEAETK